LADFVCESCSAEFDDPVCEADGSLCCPYCGSGCVVEDDLYNDDEDW
jgi:DNA-directed RNA polymerase subunit RPC12/RpoP